MFWCGKLKGYLRGYCLVTKWYKDGKEGNAKMSKVEEDTQHKDFVVVIFTCLDLRRRRMGEDGAVKLGAHIIDCPTTSLSPYN